jgi:hypothetical protein
MWLGPKPGSVGVAAVAQVVHNIIVSAANKVQVGHFYAATSDTLFSCCERLDDGSVGGWLRSRKTKVAIMHEMLVSSSDDLIPFTTQAYNDKIPESVLVTEHNLLQYKQYIDKYVYRRFRMSIEDLETRLSTVEKTRNQENMNITQYESTDFKGDLRVQKMYENLDKLYKEMGKSITTIQKNRDETIKNKIKEKEKYTFGEYETEFKNWEERLIKTPLSALEKTLESYREGLGDLKISLQEILDPILASDLGMSDGDDVLGDGDGVLGDGDGVLGKGIVVPGEGSDVPGDDGDVPGDVLDENGLLGFDLSDLPSGLDAASAGDGSGGGGGAGGVEVGGGGAGGVEVGEGVGDGSGGAESGGESEESGKESGSELGSESSESGSEGNNDDTAAKGIAKAQQQAVLAAAAARDFAVKATDAATAASQSVQDAKDKQGDGDALAGAKLAESEAKKAASEAEAAILQASIAVTEAADAADLTVAIQAQDKAEAARAAAEAAATKAEAERGSVESFLNVAQAQFQDAQMQREKAEIIQAAKDAKNAASASLLETLKVENSTADQPHMAEQAGQSNMFKSTAYDTAVEKANDAYKDIENEYDKAKQASESANNFYDQANTAESLQDAETAKKGAMDQAQIADDALKRAEKAQKNMNLAIEEAELAARDDANKITNVLAANPKRFFLLYGDTVALFKSVKGQIENPKFVFDVVSSEGIKQDVIMTSGQAQGFSVTLLTTDNADDWRAKILDYARENFKYDDHLRQRFLGVVSNISAVFEKDYADDIQTKIKEVMPGRGESQKQDILDQMQKLVKEFQLEKKSKYVPRKSFDSTVKAYKRNILTEKYSENPATFLEKYEDVLQNVQNDFSTKINKWIVEKSKIPDQAADDISKLINDEIHNINTTRGGHDSAWSLTGQKPELARTDVEHWFGENAGEKKFDLIKPLLQKFMDSQNKTPNKGGIRWPTRNETYLPADDYIRTIWPAEFQQENAFISVVIQDQKAVAFCWCEVSKNDDNTILIDKVWSPPNERFAHVGTNLTQFCLEEIYKVKKFDKIETQVIYMNMHALAFFMKKFNMQLCMGENYIMAEKLYATKHPDMSVADKHAISTFIQDVIINQIVVANNLYLNKTELYKNLLVTASSTESLQADYILQAKVSEQVQGNGIMLTFRGEDLSKQRCDLLVKILHTNCNVSAGKKEAKITISGQPHARTYSASMGKVQRQQFLKVLNVFKEYFATTIAAVNEQLYNGSSEAQTIQVNPLEQYNPSL